MSKSAADAMCRFVPPFTRYLREGLAKVSISPARFQILETLVLLGPLSMVELADNLSVTKRNITTLVDGLEKDGLANRRAHPTDRRSTLVDLTDDGRTKFHTAAKVQVAHLSRLFEQLDEDQNRELARALSLLTETLAPQRDFSNPT